MPFMNIKNLASTDVPYIRGYVVLPQLPTHLTNIFTYFIEAIFKKKVCLLYISLVLRG